MVVVFGLHPHWSSKPSGGEVQGVGKVLAGPLVPDVSGELRGLRVGRFDGSERVSRGTTSELQSLRALEFKAFGWRGRGSGSLWLDPWCRMSPANCEAFGSDGSTDLKGYRGVQPANCGPSGSVAGKAKGRTIQEMSGVSFGARCDGPRVRAPDIFFLCARRLVRRWRSLGKIQKPGAKRRRVPSDSKDGPRVHAPRMPRWYQAAT